MIFVLRDFIAMALPEFAKFDPDTDRHAVATKWQKWTERFENLMVAMDVSNAARKKAVLLHYAGERVHEIFDTLSWLFQNQQKK